jgi:hypothetical protein
MGKRISETSGQIRELRMRDSAIGVILDGAALALRERAKFANGGPFHHRDKDLTFLLAAMLEGSGGAVNG